MLGVEIIAIAPFCWAAWRLGRKVSEQQGLIEEHEFIINSQREVLDSMYDRSTLGGSSFPIKAIVAGSVVAVGAVTVYYTAKLQMLRRNVEPPPHYEPTPAVAESEECVVCLTYRKDTLFSPCQHFCTCWPCSQRFAGKACPVCRQTVEFRQFSFVS